MRQSAIADKTRQAGVIGAGGAGFPTHVKLSSSCQIVIANGAECEPLLQCDQQVMFHHGREMVRGLELALKATGASEGIIALKKKHEQVIPVLNQLIASSRSNLRLVQLGNHYPAGDEQVLVYQVSGRICAGSEAEPLLGDLTRHELCPAFRPFLSDGEAVGTAAAEPVQRH